MSEFTHFINVKLVFAARVQQCRISIEDLPVGQIVVDELGAIRSIDSSTEKVLGFENSYGMLVSNLLVDGATVFPQKLSAAKVGDLGSVTFRSIDEIPHPARIVCVPGSHQGTFLLSIVFG